jgi:hypothetical protein
LTSRIDTPVDPEEKHWGVVESFACGFQSFDGVVQRPCSSDPKFPSMEDYELVCERTSGQAGHEWTCCARPKTHMARKLWLEPAYGRSEKEVRRKMAATYLYRAGRMKNEEWFRIQIGDSSC